MKEIKNRDCKAQEIKDLQFQLNLAKQERDKVLAELAELTQEKSCERCEHSKDIAAHLNIVICTYNDDDDMPSENGTTSLKVGKNFYCKYYTPKEA